MHVPDVVTSAKLSCGHSQHKTMASSILTQCSSKTKSLMRLPLNSCTFHVFILGRQCAYDSSKERIDKIVWGDNLLSTSGCDWPLGLPSDAQISAKWTKVDTCCGTIPKLIAPLLLSNMNWSFSCTYHARPYPAFQSELFISQKWGFLWAFPGIHFLSPWKGYLKMLEGLTRIYDHYNSVSNWE